MVQPNGQDWIGSPEEWDGYGTRVNYWMNELKDIVTTATTDITGMEADIATNAADIVAAEADIDDLESLHNRPYLYAAYSSGAGQAFTTGVTGWFNSFNVASDGAGATATLASGRLLSGSADAGLWYAQANALWAGNATGVRVIYIAKNQSLSSGVHGGRYQTTVAPNGTSSMVQHVSGLFTIAGEDSFDIACFQNSGGNLSVQSNSARLTNIVAYKLCL